MNLEKISVHNIENQRHLTYLCMFLFIFENIPQHIYFHYIHQTV